MKKHTPGPWEMCSHVVGEKRLYGVRNATMGADNPSELLKACGAMVDTIDSMAGADPGNPLLIALGAHSVPYRLSRAAIAKATGKKE